MKTIIAGSRSLDRRAARMVWEAVQYAPWKITEVVSGCAAGIDRAGEEWGHQSKIPVKRFPADWGSYGRSAGPIRNKQMAEYAEALIAIWDGESRGTENMIKVARSLGLKVHVSIPKELNAAK